MTSHVNREPVQNVFEQFGQQIGFDAILSLTHLEQSTIEM